MPEKTRYTDYPLWIPVLSNSLSLTIYVIGFLVFLNYGLLFSLCYLAFCLWLEYRLIRFSCVNCWYYGRICAFGKGWVASRFFEKGHHSKFTGREISWKDIMPDLAVFLVPFLAGLFYLFFHYSFGLLFLLLLLLVLNSVGNGYVRGELACKFCRQKDVGCPAERFFDSMNKKEGSGKKRPAPLLKHHGRKR